MPRVKLGESTVHFQQAGRGPDLVLIHGLCCNLAFWYMTVLPALAERFRVTVYDLRGHGFSSMPLSGYRVTDLSLELAQLLDRLEIDTAHVVGHSFGGAIALAYAIERPDRVSSLLLADAWIPSLQAWPAQSLDRVDRLRARAQAAGVELNPEIPRVALSFLEEALDSQTDGKPAQLGELLAHVRPGSRVLRRWTALVRITSAMRDVHDPMGIERPRIRGLTPPTAAIYGGASKFLSSYRKFRRWAPRAQGAVVPGAGHFFPMTRPQPLIDAVTTFAETNSLGPIEKRSRVLTR
jgi:pimeloyl-ACP methyl ester carboxylesterase